jgi:hypothetical protein
MPNFVDKVSLDDISVRIQSKVRCECPVSELLVSPAPTNNGGSPDPADFIITNLSTAVVTRDGDPVPINVVNVESKRSGTTRIGCWL